MTELLGHSGDFALFGDGKHDGLTVIVSTKTLDTFDPQPFAGIDPTRWDEADEALVPTEAYELAEQVLATAKQVTGTDVIIAAGEADKRSFAIPKAAQAEARKALEWRKEHKRGGTDVGLNTARTLAKGGSIGIQKVRHCNRYFARHEVDKTGTGWSPGDDGYPSNGRIAWSLWGGDAAWKWTNGILRREKDLASLAADDVPPAPPEIEDEVIAPDAEILDDEDLPLVDEVAIEGMEFAPDVPHPYLPDASADYDCEVCGGRESSLIHTSEMTDTMLAAGVGSTVHVSAPERKARGLATADKFYGVDVDNDDVPDFYVGVEYRADGTPSMITGIFLRSGENWMQWNQETGSWEPAAEQDDVAPVDDDSAYAAAIMMDGSASVPASELNPPEWAMVDEARGAIPDYEAQIMEELDFCVVFGETDCDDCGDLAVTELWLKEGDGQCWRWNPVDVEWQITQNCPNECTSVDTEAAREIALRLTKEAHPATTDGRNQGKFHQLPGGGDQEIGSHLNRPHGPITQRPPNHSPSGFEFDTSFARAAWVAGTPGDTGGYMKPTATATSFASLVEEYAALTAAVTSQEKYTAEERAENAAKQFRDAKGRFAKKGDTVHIEGGRTGKVKSYDEKNDRVKVEYEDRSQQDVNRDQVTRIADADDAPDDGGEKKRIDVSKIKGEPRAVAGVTPKAWLPKLLRPMDRAALDEVLTDYEKFIEDERRRKLESFANLTPTTSDVKPLYLAQVDAVDNQAVIDLIALVPKTEKSKDLRAFVRRNGKWELDKKMLTRIRSVTPPPLVVLDKETMTAVQEQVDGYYKEKEAAGEEVTSILRAVAASAPPELWSEDGTMFPVEAVIAAGIPGIADTPSDIAAARRLRRYWLRGPGAAKILWNTPGDWQRCVKHLAKYMGPRAKGYCQNLHKKATGVYTGSKFNVGKKRRGLRGDGSALLLSLPTKTVAAPGDIAAEGIEEFPALAELNIPTVDELKNLSFRPEHHHLRVGERFLVKGGDGTYVLSVLDPTETLGWDGEPAIICGETLLREKTEART